jgi:hypothetical protein
MQDISPQRSEIIGNGLKCRPNGAEDQLSNHLFPCFFFPFESFSTAEEAAVHIELLR